MTILNQVQDPEKIAPYVTALEEVINYLDHRMNHLEMIAIDPDYERTDQYYIRGMDQAWNLLPDWAKKLLSKELP